IVYNSSNTTLNVFASTDATVDLPLLIVIRQEKGLVSLQLPNKETGRTVQNVSRILCPAYVSRDSLGLSTLYIDLYTSSVANISYSLKVSYFSSFILTENKKITTVVSPFAPVFFKYDMRTESSLVKFTSNDRICTTVSVQRMMCPVFDLKHTIDFAGQYQTMTSLAAISVDNPNLIYKSMYVVVSVHPTDRECCGSPNCTGASGHRIKNVTIELKPGYNNMNVNLSYAITLSVFLAIYVVICPFLCFVEPYCEKNLKNLIDEYKLNQTTFTVSSAVTPTSNNRIYDFPDQILHVKIEKLTEVKKVSKANLKSNEKLLAIQAVQNNKSQNFKKNPNIIKKQSNQIENQNSVNSETSPSTQNGIDSDYLHHDNLNRTSNNLTYAPAINLENNVLVNEDNSFSSSEYDKVEDAEAYKQGVRNKPNLKVHDLARKQPKLLDRKIMNYPRLIIAIATFYVLPVVQLVLLHQTQLTKSGNEDSCFFNFLCMVKSGPFAAFNNIFSNVGYILLGIMFIIVVKKRSYSYTYMRKKYPIIMSTHGVPQHFGLFYTMGIGLVMEGILSAAYHVCPSFNNFQFDTSFMYITGVVSTIKLYQCRHPDIHPSSQKVFLFLALCILLNVVGVFYGKVNAWFVIGYTIGHVGFFFILSIVIYYMKQPKLGMSTFKTMAQKFKQDKNLSQPVHIDRLIMLIIANIFNVGVAIYANLVPMQFSAYLILVLLGNFNIYFLMYLINKVIKREQFHVITVLNLIIATIAWIAAMYFYNIEIKQWEKKPAESRESNKACILLNVYDHHDAWHFLSALSMFMTFVVILTLDDGIISKKRNEISVF
ncbi:SID1 transmembrane family member 2 isoform X3, partial [Brachionus plicatilis]